MGQYSWAVPIMRYGNLWRSCRRLFHNFLSAKAVVNFDDYQYKSAHRFLARVVDSPEDFLDHVKLYVLTKIGSLAHLTYYVLRKCDWGIHTRNDVRDECYYSRRPVLARC